MLALGKRKRSLSTASSSSGVNSQNPRKDKHLPLTLDNLQRLAAATSSALPTPRPPPSSSGRSSPTKPASIDATIKEQAHGIYFLKNTPRPRLLQTHINKLLCEERREQISPNVKEVIRLQPAAQLKSERNGIRLLKASLFFLPASSSNSCPFLDDSEDENLSAAWVPLSKYDTQLKALGLEQPQPDLSFGYMLRKISTSLGLNAPFSEYEELVLQNFGALCTSLHIPFFTYQWKSMRKLGTYTEAQLQCARDGATIVNYLSALYRTAYPSREPDILQTCHFSATSDLHTIIIYVHWLQSDENGLYSYQMEKIWQAFLDDDTGELLTTTRRFMHNLRAFAFSERLQSMKDAITALGLRPNSPSKGLPSLQSLPSLDRASDSLPASTKLLPPTPSSLQLDSSSASDPSLKKRNVEASEFEQRQV